MSRAVNSEVADAVVAILKSVLFTLASKSRTCAPTLAHWEHRGGLLR